MDWKQFEYQGKVDCFFRVTAAGPAHIEVRCPWGTKRVKPIIGLPYERTALIAVAELHQDHSAEGRS